MVSTTIPVLSEDRQLHHFSLSTDETNAAIIARMRELLIGNHSNIHRFTRKTIDAVLMREPAVGKGLLLRQNDLEAQAISPRHIFKVENDAMLMKLLFGSVPVSENGGLYAYLVDALRDDHAGYMEVWCCYHVLSGRMASIWLLSALSVAGLLGLGAGVGTRDGKFGMDVGTAILAVLTGIHLSIFLGMVC